MRKKAHPIVLEALDKLGHYQCAICLGVFKKGWSDEEAQEEYKENFPGRGGDTETVCDDCFQKMHP